MKTINSTMVSLADQIASLYSIPVPLQEIADEEGLIVIYDDYDRNTFDGMTWYEPEQDQFYIHINTAMGNTPGKQRTRFTLAHELGHYFIDHHRNALIAGVMQPHIHKFNPFGTNEDWEIEREADEFAASLLMPYDAFLEDAKRERLSGDLIDRLAKKYNVSFSSCALRYMKLNLVPIMLVKADNGKVTWQQHSEDFPLWRLRYSTSKVPENTVMGDYFYNHDDSCQRSDEIVYAADCFHTFTEDQNRMEFYEYCIPYRNTAFSMFWPKN